jgi:alanyl-tRNA synthetase
MKRTKGLLQITGKTSEGMLIVKGVFPFVDTHGIPLEIVADKLHDNNMMPDWLDFWDAAIASKWSPTNTMLRMTEAIGDVYGPDFRAKWEDEFKKIIQMRPTSQLND